jgi:hypothetical protein
MSDSHTLDACGNCQHPHPKYISGGEHVSGIHVDPCWCGCKTFAAPVPPEKPALPETAPMTDTADRQDSFEFVGDRECVECQRCLFTFSAAHSDEAGNYSCPNCEEARAATVSAGRLREAAQRDPLWCVIFKRDAEPIDYVEGSPADMLARYERLAERWTGVVLCEILVPDASSAPMGESRARFDAIRAALSAEEGT